MMPSKPSSMRSNKSEKYVLDADLKGAFDHINQGKLLLNKRYTYHGDEANAIKGWLKAGAFGNGVFAAHSKRERRKGEQLAPLLVQCSPSRNGGGRNTEQAQPETGGTTHPDTVRR